MSVYINLGVILLMDVQLGLCLWLPDLSRPPHLLLKHMLFILNSLIDTILPVLIALGVLRIEAVPYGFEMALDFFLSTTNIACYLLYCMTGFVRPFKFTVIERVGLPCDPEGIPMMSPSAMQPKGHPKGVPAHSPDSFVNTELGHFDRDLRLGIDV